MGILKVYKDGKGRGHIEWEFVGVTPAMLDWWFCNMEKGYILWHPEDHKDFYWAKRPKHGNPLGAVQVTVQRIGAGDFVKDCIRWEDVEDLPEEVKEIIAYDHVVIVGLHDVAPPNKDVKERERAREFVVHQWEATEQGTRGKSSICLAPPFVVDNWLKHAQVEQQRLEHFLPQLYALWSVVKDPEINPQCCFRVVREGGRLRYAFKG